MKTLDCNHDAKAGFSASGCSASFSRAWNMPNSETFDMPAVAGFVKKYLLKSECSLDVFARNKRWATHTNDLNPSTAAQHHMDAMDFLRMVKAEGVQPDLVLFDPPYSPRQIQECYAGIGRAVTKHDTQRQCGWTKERRIISDLLAPGGVVLSFGWNSVGMGKGYRLNEVLLVCHGGGHNDTICIAEIKTTEPQSALPMRLNNAISQPSALKPLNNK